MKRTEEIGEYLKTKLENGYTITEIRLELAIPEKTLLTEKRIISPQKTETGKDIIEEETEEKAGNLKTTNIGTLSEAIMQKPLPVIKKNFEKPVEMNETLQLNILINEIQQLINEIQQLKNESQQLKNESQQLKNEISQLKEKQKKKATIAKPIEITYKKSIRASRKIEARGYRVDSGIATFFSIFCKKNGRIQQELVSQALYEYIENYSDEKWKTKLETDKIFVENQLKKKEKDEKITERNIQDSNSIQLKKIEEEKNDLLSKFQSKVELIEKTDYKDGYFSNGTFAMKQSFETIDNDVKIVYYDRITKSIEKMLSKESDGRDVMTPQHFEQIFTLIEDPKLKILFYYQFHLGKSLSILSWLTPKNIEELYQNRKTEITFQRAGSSNKKPKMEKQEVRLSAHAFSVDKVQYVQPLLDKSFQKDKRTQIIRLNPQTYQVLSEKLRDEVEKALKILKITTAYDLKSIQHGYHRFLNNF